MIRLALLLVVTIVGALSVPLHAVAAELPATKVVKQAFKKSSAASTSRLELHSTASQIASGIAAAEAALTPAELDVAAQVHTGRFPCEAGMTIELLADASVPGMFDLRLQAQRFRLSPVPTSTGAIRLEDAKLGVVWLQLANKSMLMNQKLGRRIADECHSPGQQLVADAMLTTPPASILDPAPPAAKTTSGVLPEAAVARQ
jgi:hypothetical protein